MAKDKSAKPGKGKADDKSKAKSGGKSKDERPANDGIANPSEAPAGGDGWKFADTDNIGKLMLFTPLRQDEATVTRGKKSEVVEVIVADVVVLNKKKPDKSELHEGVFIFPKWVQGSLRGFIGDRMVLGRLQQDAEKSQGDRAAWVLEDGNADDVKIAKAYLETVDPFAVKGGKSGKAKTGK